MKSPNRKKSHDIVETPETSVNGAATEQTKVGPSLLKAEMNVTLDAEASAPVDKEALLAQDMDFVRIAKLWERFIYNRSESDDDKKDVARSARRDLENAGLLSPEDTDGDTEAYFNWHDQRDAHPGTFAYVDKMAAAEKRIIEMDLDPKVLKMKTFEKMPASADWKLDLYRELRDHMQDYWRHKDEKPEEWEKRQTLIQVLEDEMQRLTPLAQDERYAALLPKKEEEEWNHLIQYEERIPLAEQAIRAAEDALREAQAALAVRMQQPDALAAPAKVDRWRGDVESMHAASGGTAKERERIQESSEMFDRGTFTQWSRQTVPGGRLGGERTYISNRQVSKEELLQNLNDREKNERENLRSQSYYVGQAELERDDLVMKEAGAVRQCEEKLAEAQGKLADLKQKITYAKSSWEITRQRAKDANVTLIERQAA